MGTTDVNITETSLHTVNVPTPTMSSDRALIENWWRLMLADFWANPTAESAAQAQQATRILRAVAAACGDAGSTR